MNGILTPIFKFPFYVHHSRYKERSAKKPVAKNPIPELSKPVNTSFRNGATGNPNEFLARTNRITCKYQAKEKTAQIHPKINLPTKTRGLWSRY